MPTRASIPPRAFPTWDALVRGFPEDKIFRVSFVGSYLHTGSCHHFFMITTRKLTIIRKALNRKEDMTFTFIGVTLFKKRYDQDDHFFHMLCRKGLHIRRKVA